jgi:hypothetical protein
MMILHNLQHPSNTPTSSTSIYQICVKLQFDIFKCYVNPRDFQQSRPTLHGKLNVRGPGPRLDFALGVTADLHVRKRKIARSTGI